MRTAFSRAAAAVLAAALLFLALPLPARAAEKNPVPEASRGVVQIAAYNDGSQYYSTGTGFGVGDAGKDTDVFVTNWHVVTDSETGRVCDRVFIMLDNADINDTDTMVECEVLYTTSGYPDLAIIRAMEPIRGFKALPLLESESVEVGTKIFALGYPGMADAYSFRTNSRIEDITVTTGIVSRFMEYAQAAVAAGVENSRVILHDALIEHGNSGGPLITEDGAVIGINTYGFGYSDSVNQYQAAVYIDYAMEALDELGIHYDVYTPSALGFSEITVFAVVIVVLAAAVVYFALTRKSTVVVQQAAPARAATAYAPTAPQPAAPAPQYGSGGYPPMTLTALAGPLAGQSFPITGAGLTVGRESGCAVTFPAQTQGVSRRHCTVAQLTADRVVLTDLGSSYGTFVGSTRLTPNSPVKLAPGTVFFLGAAENKFIVK